MRRWIRDNLHSKEEEEEEVHLGQSSSSVRKFYDGDKQWSLTEIQRFNVYQWATPLAWLFFSRIYATNNPIWSGTKGPPIKPHAHTYVHLETTERVGWVNCTTVGYGLHPAFALMVGLVSFDGGLRRSSHPRTCLNRFPTIFKDDNERQ